MLEMLRGAVRPVVLLIAVVATVAFIAFRTEVPESWWTLLGTMVAYFFISRQQTKP